MIRLLQFTDTHLMTDPDAGLRGVRTQPSLRACLAHARRRHLPRILNYLETSRRLGTAEVKAAILATQRRKRRRRAP